MIGRRNSAPSLGKKQHLPDLGLGKLRLGGGCPELESAAGRGYSRSAERPPFLARFSQTTESAHRVYIGGIKPGLITVYNVDSMPLSDWQSASISVVKT